MELHLPMRKIALALGLLLFPSIGWAQCTGVFPNNTICGNQSGVGSPPYPIPIGASGVTGPGSSVVGDAAVWNNTAGTQLKDVPFLQVYGTQSANTIFAGPTSGGAAFPTWRALVGADLPVPSTSTLGGIEAINVVTHNWIDSISALGVPHLSQPTAADIASGAALTKTDDTNVTLTLGGTPASSLLAATSLTLGWTGTLAAGRLNSNVVQGVTNDTNVTGSIATQNLTLGWTGSLALGRGGTGQTTAAAARASSGLNIDSCTSTASAGYSILATDRCIYHTTLSGAISDTLPLAASVNPGQRLYIVDFAGVASALKTITLQTSGSDTINGGSSAIAIQSQYGWSVWISDGTSRWTYQQISGGGGGGGVSSVTITASTGLSSSGTCSSTSIVNCTLSNNGVTSLNSLNGALAIVAGTGVAVTPSGSNVTIATALTTATNSLSGDISLNNTGSYFDGPSMAQGSSGTWFATGQVTLQDTTTAHVFFNCKLWDGTTVIDSARTSSNDQANSDTTIHLSGVLASPAANIRISCNDPTTTTGLIKFNASGNSKDSTITGVRLQ